jgi:hypothetical protein
MFTHSPDPAGGLGISEGLTQSPFDASTVEIARVTTQIPPSIDRGFARRTGRQMTSVVVPR